MSKKTSKVPDHCLNCGIIQNKDDNYCPNCGQRNLVDHLTFSYFSKEILSNVFSLDSKVFLTSKCLLLKPAFLSLEFIHGRRIKYVNPIQLFMFTSFLYFLAYSITFFNEEKDSEDLVNFQYSNSEHLGDSIPTQVDKSLFIVEDDFNLDTLENSFTRNLLKKSKEFNKLDSEAQNERISRNISYATFLLMPLFALYLGWIFHKKGKLYLENIVFSLHFHAFFFVTALIFFLLDKLFLGDISTYLLYPLVFLYLIVALKRFYSFDWSSTIFRFFGLLAIYGITVSVFLITTILLSVFI